MTPSSTIKCPTHGVSDYALICQHLRQATSRIGYYLIEAEPGEPAQAWCSVCDQLLACDRGWSDRADAMADWQLWCEICLARNLEGHELISLVAGSPAC